MADPAMDAADPAGTPPATSSPNPDPTGPRTVPAPLDVCPLLELASVADGGPATIDQANRCTAFAPPRALALAQQRLVCFDAAHLDCPLFVGASRGGRGIGGRSGRPVAIPAPTPVAASIPVAAAPGAASPATPMTVPAVPVTRRPTAGQARPGRGSTPTIVAGLVLVASLAVAFSFVTLRGGLALPGGAPGGSGIAAGSVGPGPTLEPTPAPTAAPTPTATPESTGEPSPTPSPTAGPSASPSPTASLPPAYAGLEPCPDRPDCYLYRIHSGDNLTALAGRFGITLKALREANPEIKDPSLIHVGDIIRIPLPPA